MSSHPRPKDPQDIHFSFLNDREVLAIKKLYRTVFDLNLTDAELLWRFAENPYLEGNGYNCVAKTDGGEIVGHSAFIPAKFRQGSTPLRGALSVGAMVLPSHSGLFLKLLSHLEQKLQADGCDFLYSFPNPNSYPFHRFLGYEDGHFEYLQLASEALQMGRNKRCPEVHNLVQNASEDLFLNWRLHQSPVHEYRSHEGPNLRAVYKFYGSKEVDILHFRPKTACLEGALSELLQREPLARRWNLYCTTPTWSECFKALGFQAVVTKNRMVFKMLSGRLSKPQFHLEMMDNDIF